jgi:UPF0271 protein
MMSERILDLNCDLGEGSPHDAELMPLITTASVACGFHAGDAPTALATIRLAARHGVRVGAHPAFPDREHFGRRELERSPDDVLADCLYQIGALEGLSALAGTRLSHVKPHGALYNMAMRDERLAGAVIEAAERFSLPLLGLPGSRLEALCAGRVRFIAEGFADRRYREDGSLVPRAQPDAMIETPAAAAEQALVLLQRGAVRTLCVHGDNPGAVQFVREVRQRLLEQGVAIRSFA